MQDMTAIASDLSASQYPIEHKSSLGSVDEDGDKVGDYEDSEDTTFPPSL